MSTKFLKLNNKLLYNNGHFVKIDGTAMAKTPEEKTVIPTQSQQNITPTDNEHELSTVIVEPIPSEYIIPTGDITITENGTVDVTNYENAVVNVPAPTIETEEKTATPTISQQDITPSAGKYLSKVTVNAVTNSIDSNITAENIKQGISILGVTGTLEQSASEESFSFDFDEETGTLTITNDNPMIGLIDRTATDLVIPNGTTKIGTYAFYNCSSLTSITIPSSVTSIGSYAFFYCTSLRSITIPSSVISIGDYAFGRGVLANITISEGVRTLGSNVFYLVKDLANVTIPSSVTSMGDTFSNCSNLTSVTILGVNTSMGSKTFGSCAAITSVNLPNGFTKNIYLNYSNNLTVDSLHDMISKVADKTGTTAGIFKVGATNVAKITAEDKALLITKNWTLS